MIRQAAGLVGRITRSARRLTLHLPRRWPWETQFSRALARLQAMTASYESPTKVPTIDRAYQT